MRSFVLLCLLAFAPGLAQAQVVQRCKGESFVELASLRLKEARLGPLLGLFNRHDKSDCKVGRFVRFPAGIRHEVRLGQTIASIAGRFTQGRGGAAFIRELNGLPRGGEPKAGSTLIVPSEMALKLGTRPEKEIQAIFGLPSIKVLKKYNRVRRFKKGGTIYVPLVFDLVPLAGASAPAVTPPPKPEPPEGEPAKVVDPKTLPDADPTEVAKSPAPPPAELTRVLQVAVAARYDAFAHPMHESIMKDGWTCAQCHASDPRRPHEYYPVPEALCTQCHSSAEVTPSALRAYRLELSFSHDQHLNPKAEAQDKGYELSCDDCHPAIRGKAGRRGQPGHGQCIKCHNEREVKPLVETECAGCHDWAESLDRRTQAKALLAEHYRRSERHTDLVFGHEEHLAQLTEDDETKSCDRCHVGARTAVTMAEIEPMRMADCMGCHRGLERDMGRDSVRLDRCRTCHVSTRAEVAPVMSSLLHKPLSHSGTFRRRHGAQAAADDGVCSACHTELAGGSGNNCNACHQQIRPQDHTARWLQTPHGRAAARDVDRCATCHLKDRCTDCHAQAPRDHFPRRVFQLRHGRSARISTRRCMTCHVPQIDCARCHDVARL